jgi:MFS family permease
LLPGACVSGTIMSQQTNRGFGPVLANPHFRSLWMAQLLCQTSQHAIHFVQLVLIEQLTGSAMHIGFTILAFSLPGVIFSPIAGVVVDRFPKKYVLVVSNLARVVLAVGYVVVLATLHGTWELLAIYTLTFLTATLAQFFGPAEAATIPLLVGEERLYAANSLFSLTMIVSQVVGLLILGPLVVSLASVQGGFLIISAMYLAAAILVSTLPRDKPHTGATAVAISRREVWTGFKEGLQFVSGRPQLQSAMVHLVTITTLVMVMAMLAPGYSARVLGMAPQNAFIVFVPAGIGMLAASLVAGRWGHVLRRFHFGYIALIMAGLLFAALGLLSMDYQRLLQPILQVYPGAAFSLTSGTMFIGLLLGLCMSTANILAQTVLQRESPAHLRGRVFSVQFMLNNLMGIPPMLALGRMADAVGIPPVLITTGLITIGMAAISLLIRRQVIRVRVKFEPSGAGFDASERAEGPRNSKCVIGRSELE